MSAPDPASNAGSGPVRSQGLGGRAWSVAAALVAVALFIRTVTYGWAYDDFMEVTLNTFIRSWSNLPEIFSTTVWTGSGMETYLYRPLGQVTFLVNHTISGLEPWSYHLVNVLLHAGIAALMVRVGVRWGLPVAAAGIGAVLFALHPIHVEAVAAVHGRKELLATIFILGMFLVHPRARDQGGRAVLWAVLLFGGALLSKETGVVAVALVAAADLLSGRRREILASGAARGLYAAYGSILALYMLVRTRVTGTLSVPETFVWDNPLVAADLPERVWTGVALLGRGLGSLVFPRVLSPDYSFNAIPVVGSPTDPRFLIAAVALAAIGAAAVRLRSARPWVTLAAAWYLLSILPASNLLVPVGTIFGDRLLYLPSVAFCLAAGGVFHLGLEGPAHRGSRILTAAGVGVLALGWTVRTVQYTGAWTDDIALFEWAVEAVPGSTKAHHKLGEEYLRAGRAAEALGPLDRALEIAPGNTFAAATRAQAVERLVQEHREVFRDPMGAALPSDPAVLRELAELLEDRGQADGARRLRAAVGEPES